MAVYELAIATTSTSSNAPMAEILSPTRPASLLEFGFTTATGATTTELRRPSNTPTGGTATNATATTSLDGAGTSSLGIIISGWTLAPTVAAGGLHVPIRLVSLSGSTMGWLPGEMVVGTSRANSFLVWGQSAPPAGQQIYLRWEE